MKLPGFSISFQPLYVLVAGTLGIFFAALLFIWSYPLPGDPKGEAFVSVPEYWVWVFLFAVLFALLTIFFIPAWLSLIATFKNWVLDSPGASNWSSVLVLLLATLVLLGFLAMVSSTLSTIQLDFRDAFPLGHQERMSVVFAGIVLVLLPVMLVILLLYSASQQLYKAISAAGGDESKLFPIVDQVLELRQTLQNHLLIAGIILSLVPIMTAGLRAIVIAIDPAAENSMPMTIVFAYGLTFTLLLIFVFTPTHLALSQCSRQLRDGLCDINSISELEDKFKTRRILDELLQTNLGLGQNLKTGIVTLAPLVTGLIVSLLGINI